MGTIKLTVGAIWKNKKTGEEFELLGHNLETDRVQLFPVKKNGNIAPSYMTANSLRKNYVAVAKRITKENEVELKMAEQPKLETKTNGEAKPARKFGRVELANGRVVSGIDFIRNYSGTTEAETCKNNNAIWWLGETAKGKELLAKCGAQIVYKPLTK